MCCFMEKMLANMLADFEMKVEKAVLEPLNKLSEVSMARTAARRSSLKFIYTGVAVADRVSNCSSLTKVLFIAPVMFWIALHCWVFVLFFPSSLWIHLQVCTVCTCVNVFLLISVPVCCLNKCMDNLL